MSYAKMMKWGRTHKGKSQYMGFNPSGITSKELDERERNFVSEMKNKTLQERDDFWNKAQEVIKVYKGSWDWTWCAFQRHFVYNNKVR